MVRGANQVGLYLDKYSHEVGILGGRLTSTPSWVETDVLTHALNMHGNISRPILSHLQGWSRPSSRGSFRPRSRA